MKEQSDKWEKAIIHTLNLDGWQLQWTGKDFEHYDAKGKTPKGYDCIIEIKVRNKYYQEKIIEKYKYDKLMKDQCLKFYYIADEKGNYLYFLDELKLPIVTIIEAKTTTSFNNKEVVKKEVYKLSESQAVIVNKY
jgi:hypothetical protein